MRELLQLLGFQVFCQPVPFFLQFGEAGGRIANHEFEKARFYSQEEGKERENLKQLREKHKLDNVPALNIGREEIEKAVSKLVGNSGDSGSTTS